MTVVNEEVGGTNEQHIPRYGRPGSARKRVLLLTEGLGMGGAERQLVLLARHLPPEWERRVWSLSGGPFVPVLRAAGVSVDVRKRRYRRDISPFVDLFRLLREWQPSVVHSWGGLCSVVAGPMCRLMRVPWIDGSVRNGFGGRGEHFRRFRGMVMTLADRVVANSQSGLDAWRIPRTKGRVVYNGFDFTRIGLINGRRPDAKPFRVVMAARMEREKDFQGFLRAAEMVTTTQEAASWHFLAIGAGSHRSSLIHSAEDLATRGIVAFPEAGINVIPYVQEAHAGVLMTNPAFLEEGLSNTIMEYMACGLPVVCSESGGNRELVVDGDTGFIVRPMDPASVANRLTWLRDNPTLASEMGDRGKRRITERFGIGQMVRGMTGVYQEIVR